MDLTWQSWSLGELIHYRNTHFDVRCLKAVGMAEVESRPYGTTTHVGFNTAAQLCCTAACDRTERVYFILEIILTNGTCFLGALCSLLTTLINDY